jgi:hypothetical protein
MQTQRYAEIEHEVSDGEYAERVASSKEAALDKVIEATEQAMSLDDFRQEKLTARCSFDLSTPRGQQLWIEANNAEHLSLKKAAGMTWGVVDWIAWHKEVIRTDGTIDPNGLVVCLFCEDGSTISWASNTTSRQWAAWVRAKGDGPYSPPLLVRVVANESKDESKGPWFSLLPPACPVEK